MKELIRQFMSAIKSRATGMTYIRKFGAAPKPGHTIVVFLSMIAVPNEDAARITSELHCPTLGSSALSEDVVVLSISTGEGKDVSHLSLGNGFDGIAREAIWRF